MNLSQEWRLEMSHFHFHFLPAIPAKRHESAEPATFLLFVEPHKTNLGYNSAPVF